MSKAYVRGQDGKVFTVDQEELGQAQDAGYDLLTPAETYEHVRRKEVEKIYGSPADIIETAALEFAGEATFGLSDLIVGQHALDLYDRKEREQRREAAGGYATAAKIGGLVLPLLATGGGAALAKGGTAAAKKGLGSAIRQASTAPVEALIRSGKYAETAAGTALAGFAKQGVIQEGLSKIAQKAAGSATEGLFYGSGRLMSEIGLGDTELNGELLWSTLAMNTLAGGVVGGAFPTLGILGKPAIAATKRIAKLAPGMGSLNKWYDEAQAMVTGQTADDFFAPGPKGRALREEILDADDKIPIYTRKATDTLDKMHRNSDAIHRQATGLNKQMQIQMRIAQEKLTPGTLASESATVIEQMAARVHKIVRDRNRLMEYSDPDILRQLDTRLIKAYDDISEIFKKPATPQSSQKVFKIIDDLKGDIQQQTKIFRSSAREGFTMNKQTIDLFNDLWQIPRRMLEKEEIWGSVASGIQKDVNQAFSRHLSMTDVPMTNQLFTPYKGIGIGRAEMRTDPARVQNMIKNSLDEGDSLFREWFDEFVTTRLDLDDAIARNYDLSDDIVKLVKENKKLAEELNDTLGKGSAYISNKSKWSAIRTAEAEAAAGAGPMVAGAFLGGLPGALLGSAVGMFAKPAKAVKFMRTKERFIEKHLAPVGYMSAVEGAINKSSKRISDSLNGFMNGKKSAAKTASTLAILKSIDLIGEKPKSNTDIQQEYTRLINQLDTVMQNPEVAMNNMHSALGRAADVAPELSNVAVTKGMNSLAYAREKAPRANPAMSIGLQPQHYQLKLSPQKIAEWAKVLKVAIDPLSVLDDLGSETLNIASARALADLHPELYEEIGIKIMEMSTELQVKLPYKKQNQLSIFFGVPINGTQTASFMDFAQKNIKVAQAQQQQGRTKPESNGKVGKLRSSYSYHQQHLNMPRETPTNRIG